MILFLYVHALSTLTHTHCHLGNIDDGLGLLQFIHLAVWLSLYTHEKLVTHVSFGSLVVGSLYDNNAVYIRTNKHLIGDKAAFV